MSGEFDRRFDPSQAVRNGQLGAKDRDKIRLSHPAPWSVEETATCFVVRNRNGQVLSRVYFKYQHGRRLVEFSRDEARHLASAVAKLPELVREQ
jgi:hypothetical protein